MGWAGRLTLHYRHDGTRTISEDRHHGPLRVLARLYPEAPGICHHVMVHPPGGIVGGDRLEIAAEVGAGAHALITTPGATRFYRSAGEPAEQSLQARIAGTGRFEWLPLETLVYRGALARNRARFELDEGAEMIGWDLLALGLPAAQQAFDVGSYAQEIEIPGVWLERGRIDAADRRLLDSPLGWDGQHVLATLWFAAGHALDERLAERLVEDARDEAAASPLAARAGATVPHAQLVLLRALAPRVEPALQLLTRIWARWRTRAWQLAPCPPRVWRT